MFALPRCSYGRIRGPVSGPQNVMVVLVCRFTAIHFPRLPQCSMLAPITLQSLMVDSWVLYHCPYLGPCFTWNLSTLLPSGLARRYQILRCTFPRRVPLSVVGVLLSARGVGCLTLLSIEPFCDEIHPGWLMTTLFLPFGPFAGRARSLWRSSAGWW